MGHSAKFKDSWKIFLMLVPALGCISAPAYAKETAGTYGGAFLLIPTGVRSMGMGDTGAALSYGSNGAVYNPANIAYAENVDFSFSYQDLLTDSSLGFLGYAQPTKARGISELGGTAFFSTLRYVDHGKMEVNYLNTDGSLDRTENVKAGTDLVWSVGYAEHFLKSENAIHSLGFSAGLVHSTLVEKYSATAVSLGVGYFCKFEKLSIGISASNMGSELKYIEYGDPLPVSLRFGASYPVSVHKNIAMLIAADGVYEEKSFHPRTGLEAKWNDLFALRAGWRFEPESFRGGPTFGFGISRAEFFMDYAFGYYGDLAATHRVLLGAKFSRFPLGRPKRRKL